MAQFLPAWEISKVNAGGYILPPSGETSGETYRDIDRKYNPGWVGWEKIDALKKVAPIKTNFTSPELDALASQFFKAKFWAPYFFDNLKSQAIANMLFDQTFDGPGRTVRMMKRVLNKNFGGKFTDDSKGIAEVITAINKAPEKQFFEAFKMLRQKRFQYAGHALSPSDPDYAFFVKFGAPPPEGEKYLKGWLNRVNKYAFAGAAISGAVILTGLVIFFFITNNKK